MFEKLLGLSLERSIEIMELKPNEKSKHYARIISTQQAIMSSVYATAARIDEAKLKQGTGDKVGELLEQMRAYQERENQTLDVTPPANGHAKPDSAVN